MYKRIWQPIEADVLFSVNSMAMLMKDKHACVCMCVMKADNVVSHVRTELCTAVWCF